ncbi:cryptochrome [Lasiosphaeris hirsuta]|uniref:Cryptochrome DASH n=1 Tax=Lasiosphaeris hirsuta TaxID=260670 RepID=A0AA40B9F1_9PEZI|nr:cryptochrome [Lasiosphaeris hirsuta]
MAAKANVLIFIHRRDLRVSDNPIYAELAANRASFTHLVPVVIFPASQYEVSGFIVDGSDSPFPEARSQIARYWRCGPHRAKFVGEAVWNLKESLLSLGSELLIRVGVVEDVVRALAQGLNKEGLNVGAVWMTGLEGTEEQQAENAMAKVCEEKGVEFKLWADEKYYVDDRDVVLAVSETPDVFTSYRKLNEPLREKPRATLPRPSKGSLPPFPEPNMIPPQSSPFSAPETRSGLIEALLKPIKDILPDPPSFPEKAISAHPFEGGESSAQDRLISCIQSGGAKNYKDTRNGLTGTQFSTKLSAFLAQGCLTSRQIHHMLLGYENGTDARFESAEGYGAGENPGTSAIRQELFWRDYMRLCHKKYKDKLFRIEGYKGYKDEEKNPRWKSPVQERALPNQDPSPERIHEMLGRFNAGTTGMGLIDASQRELFHTGYTSNRVRQNVASFLAKHLSIDWRYGAEWYEMMLVDYDVSSNWGNWQYVSGVGNDPRSDLRIFNPVKQAFDYDKEGTYVRMWVPEAASLTKLENIFQPWTASKQDLMAVGIDNHIMVTDPIKRIEFSVDAKPVKPSKRSYFRRRDHDKGEDQAAASDGRGEANGHGGSGAPRGSAGDATASKGVGAPRGGPPRGGRGQGSGYRGHRTPHFGQRGGGSVHGAGAGAGAGAGTGGGGGGGGGYRGARYASGGRGSYTPGGRAGYPGQLGPQLHRPGG